MSDPADRGFLLSLQPMATNSGMLGRMLRLALKELRETLRDRRTIVTLVLMPVLIYPLLSIAFQRFLVTSIRQSTQPVYRVGVDSKKSIAVIKNLLNMGERLLARQDRTPTDTTDDLASQEQDGPLKTAPFGALPKEQIANIEYFVSPNPEAATANFTCDLGIRIVETHPFRFIIDRAVDCELYCVQTSPTSRAALEYVNRRLQEVNKENLQHRLQHLGMKQRTVPVKTEHKSIKSTATPASFSLSTLVPLILILMTITGAVYPAIDLTAGERERGTLEMLIAAPVPRLGLLLAKYIAVLTVALLTATVNLVSMTVTIFSIGLGSMLFGESGLSVLIMLQVFGLLILFAAFFSAVLLALTSFARSFKEAQAYLIPLMLISLAPGMLSMIPDLELRGLLAWAPLANVVLLARDLFEHQAKPMMTLVVVSSTALYALAAIFVAARIFGTDSVLYGSPGSWSDLFRRPAKLLNVPSSASAMFCLALMFPGFILLGNLVGRMTDVSMAQRLGLNSLITILLCGGIPLGIAALTRVSVRCGFQLKPAALLAYPAAILLGISLWPLVSEIVIWSKRYGLATFDIEQVEWARILIDELRSISPVWLLLTLAVVPAVFEELFFRGFLLGALRGRTSATNAILISGVLFSLFHIVVRESLAIERLLPTTLLGIVLGWVCHRTGSLFPGILLHVFHNGTLLMITYYQKTLSQRGWDIENAEHLPASWLLTAAVGAAAGFALMAISRRNRNTAK